MKQIIVIFSALVSMQSMYGQYVLKNNKDVEWYNAIPQEAIILHSNNSTLLAGEYLSYKLYCKNYTTKKLSTNSKIAYVELVGEAGVVFKHKIQLDSGVGQGDFFLPASLKTGHYKLIAYTRWMTNAVDTHFFQTDINIINPFNSINFEEGSAYTKQSLETEITNSQNIQLTIDSKSYKKREEVNLIVASQDPSARLGSYSIAVRKLDEITTNYERHSNSQSNSIHHNNTVRVNKTIGDEIYLPEFKGEIVSGVISEKTTGEKAKNLDVVLSVLSDEAFQDVAKTNSEGVFYFNLPKDYSTPKILIQVLGDNRSTYKIDMIEAPMIDHSVLDFHDLKLHIDDKEAIISRSVNNQIENAYASVKQDKIITPNYPKPFYGNPMILYNLDDYKRFPTVAETLTEVVDHAWHERKNGKQRYINVRERETDPYYEVDIHPMIIIDGMFYQNHTDILEMDANSVKSIGVLRYEYYYSDKVFQGALVLNTIDGDYYRTATKDHEKIIDLLSPELKTQYYELDYSKETDYSRIPDLRTQLLWQPEFKFLGKENTIKFFTSDNLGTYEVSLQGFDSDGNPVSIKQTFTVE